jgi:hypothetical protein
MPFTSFFKKSSADFLDIKCKKYSKFLYDGKGIV